MRTHANLWINSLDEVENAGHNDSLSLQDPDGVWGWFLDRGINIIQTDFPQKAPQYAEQRFAKRT